MARSQRQPSTKEKYEWLLKQLKITDVDLEENDALLKFRKPIYFQFHRDFDFKLDSCVIQAMKEKKL